MKPQSRYRQQVSSTLARLKKPSPLATAIAASRRLVATAKAQAGPAIEVDQGALKRLQKGWASARKAGREQ